MPGIDQIVPGLPQFRCNGGAVSVTDTRAGHLVRGWEDTMRRMPFLSLAALGVGAAVGLGAIGASVAAPPPGDSDKPGRYSMQPAEGGFLRLDTVTGDVSLCARSAQTFECKPVKDDRDLQAELARLSTENKELRGEIKRLEDMLGLNGGPHKGNRKLELPTEEDVDKALSYVERMLKKFRDKIKEFDLDGGSSGKGTPL